MGIGGFELFLILLFGFLIFGPDKLPEIAKTVGKAINKFKSAQEEMSKVIQTEVYDPNADDPLKKPLEALTKLGDSIKSEDSKGQKASKETSVEASAIPDEKTESFSERKARYDRERAAQKKAEKEDVPEEKEGAKQVPGEEKATSPSEKTVTDASESKEDLKVTEPASRPSADELYGNTPPAAQDSEPKEEEEA